MSETNTPEWLRTPLVAARRRVTVAESRLARHDNKRAALVIDLDRLRAEAEALAVEAATSDD